MDDQELCQWLNKNFGINPKELDEYRTALTMGQYQILEFFGDSILGFIISEYLFTKYSASVDRPGWFNDVRDELVKNENLARIANKLGIAAVVIIATTTNRQQVTNRVVADVLEALIAAIYLEQGLKKCQEVIERVFDLERENPISALLEQENPISALQKLLAKEGESPEYTEIGRVGEPHKPIFTLEATCRFRSKTLVADGTGKSLQEAKKIAAQNLLIKVIELYNKHFWDTQ